MYNKIFTKILDSSIWLEDASTRLVWLTFIASMDEEGFVQFAAPANVAHRARISVEDAEKALKCLESNDENSSDPEFDGRRIERIPGGWIVLNADKYRQMVTREVIKNQTKERVRRFRLKLNEDVTQCNAVKQNVTNDNANVTNSNENVTPSVAATATAAKAKKTKAGAEPFLAELPKTLDTPNFIATWNDWIKYRKEAKLRNLQPASIQKMWKQMESWGEVKSIQAINLSISNCWAGIFEPKIVNQPKQSSPTLPADHPLNWAV